MRKLITQVTQFLRRVATSPVGELNRAQRFMRYCYDLTIHCSRALRHDRAGEMAAALTYRTIFSLVPFLVVFLLVFQSFRGLEGFKNDLQPIVYKFMGIDAMNVPTDAQRVVEKDKAAPSKETKDKPKPNLLDDSPPTPIGKDPPDEKLIDDTPGDAAVAAKDGGTEGSDAPPANVDSQMMVRVDTTLSNLIDTVGSLDFKSIGIIGFILFLWAAIELAVTIELSFNRVFNCPSGRPWHRRIPVYWAVITLGPVLLLASVTIAGRLVDTAADIPVLSTIVNYASSLFALSASWLLLFLLFKLMPNTTVNAGAALAGSFAAAVLWEIGKYGFGLYVSKFLPYAKLYGVLGLLPLFLFWIYITWWIVLFGLELTYTLQAMGGRKFKYALPSQQQDKTTGDPSWIIPIMTQIGYAFGQGKAMDSYKLADRLNLPDRLVVALCVKLEGAGLIHRVVHGDEQGSRYTLAQPPEQIQMPRLLDLCETIREGTGPMRKQAGWKFLRRMTQVQRDAVADQTLADLLLEMPAMEDAQASDSAVKANGHESDTGHEAIEAEAPSR